MTALATPKTSSSRIASICSRNGANYCFPRNALGSRDMRIAQVAPLIESVPPKLTGGTYGLISYLTEELVNLGHEVTLFASGDSVTKAHLIPGCQTALRWDFGRDGDEKPYPEMVKQVFARASEFDVIHFHWIGEDIALDAEHRDKTLVTPHWRLDEPNREAFFGRLQDVAVVSVSHAQREPLPRLKWQGTVHNGIPDARFSLRPGHGTYLAFLGRLSPEKRPDRAIRIAQLVGIQIKVAGSPELRDRAYFDEVASPLLDDSFVEYTGEIDDQQKSDFLGNALALLFPIDWPEPFGLVMIEAMACGTPVIAFQRGGVPEIIDDGVSGFLVDDVMGAVRAVERIPTLDRRAIRKAFEDRFTIGRVAREYVSIYERLAKH